MLLIDVAGKGGDCEGVGVGMGDSSTLIGQGFHTM